MRPTISSKYKQASKAEIKMKTKNLDYISFQEVRRKYKKAQKALNFSLNQLQECS